MSCAARILVLLGVGWLALPAGAEAREARRGLTQQDMQSRSARVSKVVYTLDLKLDGRGPEYSGRIQLHFQLRDATVPLTVDFNDGSVQSVVVNGKPQKVVYNGLFITLPPAALRAGANTVEIGYRHPYSTSGAGLYRFTDPLDQGVYVYTNFEPYDANRLFPSFDQPDLKASYALNVEVPADWTVVSARRESAVETLAGERRRWRFPATRRFSTYLFPVHAGPFRIWEDDASAIPSRLLARRSIAERVPVQDWFRVTRQGFAFFQEYFDYPYPFEKYDQVLVPDFNSGAMENVGAVTFNELYAPHGTATRAQRMRRANVILHEMAHMWFGNLVTMKWWNDLWLNESFATYMAYLAMVEGTEFDDGWRRFFTRSKRRAYIEDALVTTHPIETPVADTEQAFANFDRITYGKGASSLKQLAYLIGADKFRAGVRAYFKQNAFGNTVLEDFIGALARAADRDLARWTEQWLRTAGPNTVQADFTCDQGVILGFSLNQSAPPEHPVLRTHRTQVGLYRRGGDGGTLQLYRAVTAIYEGERTVIEELRGALCPDFVYPNHGDHDYAKVRLDSTSLQAVRVGVDALSEPFVRAMVWLTLWDMVRDGQLGAEDFVKLAASELETEQDRSVAQFVAERLYQSTGDMRGARVRRDMLRYLVPGATRDGLRRALEELFWRRLNSAVAGSDFQKLWLDSYVAVAESPLAQGRLVEFLGAKPVVEGLEVDQQRRWEVIWRLNTLGHARGTDLIQAERRRDPSNEGQGLAIASEAARPEEKTKRKWFNAVTQAQGKRPLAELKNAMAALFPPGQAAWAAPFDEAFYTRAAAVSTAQENPFQRYFASLAPARCTAQSAARMQAFVDKNPGLNAVFIKTLRQIAQEDALCARLRGAPVAD